MVKITDFLHYTKWREVWICEFSKSEIKSVGHMLNADGILTDPAGKVLAIRREWRKEASRYGKYQQQHYILVGCVIAIQWLHSPLHP